jgi:hypothetical protein
MKAMHGTAIYTGGGLYITIGQLDNGYYFFGYYESCDIFKEDTRAIDEDNNELACLYPEWYEENRIEWDQNEVDEMHKDFCRRLDSGEKDLTAGYERFSNYVAGEVYDYMDFPEAAESDNKGDYRKPTPESYEIHPEDIAEKLTQLADFGNDTESEERAKKDLLDAIYYLDTLCQNENNSNYFRTFYNVLARITEE